MKNIRMRREDGKWIISTLVECEIHTSNSMYEPSPAIKQYGIEKQYMDNGRYSQQKSEARKQHILSEIAKIRKELANIAISKCHKDENTICRPNPVKAKEAIASLQSTSKLVDNLFRAI